MKLKISVLLASLGVVGSLWAATKGSCEKEAVALKASQNVRLVAEYDPDWKEYDEDSGVYYYYITLNRGRAYTIWLEGANSEELGLEGYPREETDAEWERDIWAPFATFEDGGISGKTVCYLESDSWDEEDPSSWKYFVVVSGDVGQGTTLRFVEGHEPFVPEGSAENPKKLTFKESRQTLKAKYVEDEGTYEIISTLAQGREYKLRSTNGTVEEPVGILVDGSEDDFEIIPDPDYTDVNNPAYIIRPKNTAEIRVVVSGLGESFSLDYQMIPARKIADHPSTVLTAGQTVNFVPGRLNATTDYADEIVDEWLFKVTTKKGERWVFDTTGADRPIRMVLYDKSGKVLTTNESKAKESFDVRIGYEATVAGVIYVGVYNPELSYTDPVVGAAVDLKAMLATSVAGSPDAWDDRDDTLLGANALDAAFAGEAVAHGPHQLGATDWEDCFAIATRKGVSYRLTVVQEDVQATAFNLKAELLTLSGTKETLVKELVLKSVSEVEFEAEKNTTYYLRLSVAEGKGLDFPAYAVKATAFSDEGAYRLVVKTKGVNGQWSLDRETEKYPAGSSVIVSGPTTVKFTAVKGFSTPANVVVNPPTEGNTVEIEGVFNDTADPKDNVATGATKISISSKERTLARTLFKDDPADWFAFSAKEGYYYNFKLKDLVGHAKMAIYRKAGMVLEAVGNEAIQAWPAPVKGDYLLVVEQEIPEIPEDSSYTLVYSSANVGAIKFAKDKVSAKKNAGVVKLTVKRTAKEGRVRVRYGTVAGTALPGERYVAQTGLLEWAANDSKAKTIEIALIPELVAFYTGTSSSFQVQLKALEEEELEEGEYLASISVDTCTVTLTDANTTKKQDSIEAVYAAKMPVKPATVKTELVALSTGSFTGVLQEDGSALTNGLPRLASVTFTASTAANPVLSAKVLIAGSTYTFKGTGWDYADDTSCEKTLELVQKVANVAYTNRLTLVVNEGYTGDSGAWLNASAEVELEMNIPDANKKGVQEGIVYRGSIYRANYKIQEYLNVVTNFVGYYTVSLVPEGVSVLDGIPAGNSFLTLTVDNKGKVKVGGQLADGATKPSLTVQACRLERDESSPLGYAMVVPLYYVKNPVCFGGELRLLAQPGQTLPNKPYEIVVDSTQMLMWNNDNAKVTYDGEEGYSIDLTPCGGWYDKVVNLQAYYLNYALEVGTAEITEFPTELLASGYDFALEVEPNQTAVGLVNDAFSTEKKALVKVGKLYDLAKSTNACNVQVKIARATGLVNGSFSVWSENEDGSAQKEISGFKHNGVLLMSVDEAATIDPDTVSAGFAVKTGIKVSTEADYNEKTKKYSTRSWTFSIPFFLLGQEQGTVDPWANDWGEQPW